MIDSFLAEAKAMEDRCPTDDELKTAKSYVKYMDCITREDHLRSIDELLAKVPNEFSAAVRLLEAAEEFILIAASGVVERVRRKLDADWELINAVDVSTLRWCSMSSAARAGRVRAASARDGVQPILTMPLLRWCVQHPDQRDGHTALHSASACNNDEVVSLLLERGAKVNTQDVRRGRCVASMKGDAVIERPLTVAALCVCDARMLGRAVRRLHTTSLGSGKQLGGGHGPAVTSWR